MKNPSMEETIFDAVLTRAFADAFTEELAELERDCPETVDYPENYRKIERKAYRKRWGGGFRRSRWNRTMQRAAAWILVIGLTGGMLVMMIPEVRAGFRNLVATSFEKYVEFESVNKNSSYSINTDEYIIKYIPNEYMQTSYDDFIGITYTFESRIHDRDFTLSYVPEGVASIYHDNEHTTFTQCSVNGNTAYYIQNESGDWSELLWNDGFNVFSIYGTISEEMM
ncbi:MAG: DUF4367 domain-containing protein, partial [Clostridia bacterium]|nr:DUF4367 domain-containing protein [Clostridia bacterium]